MPILGISSRRSPRPEDGCEASVKFFTDLQLPQAKEAMMRVACQEELSWRDVHWTAPLWQLLAALERLSSLHPVSVLARKRLDVSFQDIGRACRLSLESLLLPGAASEAVREEASLDVSRAWLPASSKFSSSIRRRRSGPRLAPPPAPRAPSRTAPVATSPAPATREAVSAVTAAVAPFLSVRTAFDLYLKTLKLPRGSLVICSALTIPDMVTIFEEHGLVPVPVDLDPETLAPEPGSLEAEVERYGGGCDVVENGVGAQQQQQRVRAIYVAHVFGAQVDMTLISEAAARHDLLLWEDCAQVFTGLGGYLGHPESDATFFSFGVIKRATALGGGVARIRDADVLSAMLREEAEYPSQSAMTYLRRVLKCSLLLAFTTPLLYGIIIRTLGLLGIEHDEVVMKLSKGFPKKGLMKAIRHRASIPLLQMIAWRISRYSTEGVEVRLRHCNRMLSVLETALAVPRRHQPQRPRGRRLPRESQQQRLPPPPPPLSSPEGGDGCPTTAAGAAAADTSTSKGQRQGPGAGRRRGGEEAEKRGGGGGVGDILPGIKAHRHTLWLYPVMVEGGPDRASGVVKALLREGYDATRAPTSLMPIDRCTTTTTPKTSNHNLDATSTPTALQSCLPLSSPSPPPQGSCLTPRCSAMMDSLVYLPLANNVPDSEVDRMALALARALLASSSSAPCVLGRQDAGSAAAATAGHAGPHKGIRGANSERGAVARSLIAFALRLDVIVVSTVFLVLMVMPLVVLACLSW